MENDRKITISYRAAKSIFGMLMASREHVHFAETSSHVSSLRELIKGGYVPDSSDLNEAMFKYVNAHSYTCSDAEIECIVEGIPAENRQQMITEILNNLYRVHVYGGKEMGERPKEQYMRLASLLESKGYVVPNKELLTRSNTGLPGGQPKAGAGAEQLGA